MCRFLFPAFQRGFCCCLAKMNEPAKETKQENEDEAKEEIVKEPRSNNATNFNQEIDKPKITFQEHDPPTQPSIQTTNNNLANVKLPECLKCAQCTCVLRSTSVGQIDSNQIRGLISPQKTNLPVTTRPNITTSAIKQQSIVTTRTSSSSSNDSNTEPTNHIHCLHHRFLGTETTNTHHLTNASPLLGFPKAISHNDATVFRQINSIDPSNQSSGLEVRRLSDSAALNSTTNKPTSGASSFMPTRRCVLRLDGCSYLIVANPPETTKSKDASSKSNETIVVRKSAQLKPVSGLRSLGSSTEQQSGISGFETEIENASSIQRTGHLGPPLLSADSVPPVDTLQACDKAATRLRELIRHIDHGQVSPQVLKKTLQYAACVLDTVSMDETSNTSRASKSAQLKIPTIKQTSDSNNNRASPVTRTAKLANIGRAASEVPVSSILASQNKTTIIPSPTLITKTHQHPHTFTSPCTKTTEHNLNATNIFNQTDANRRILDEEDDLSEVHQDAVPTEVREWLATTFTKQPNIQKRKHEDKPKFRSVANAIRAGIMVNRIYRSQVGPSVMQIPSDIIENIKTIDNWSFDCFTLNEKAKNQSLKYVTFELMNRYGLLSKFKIPQTYMENFIFQIEQGYLKNKNPYHNNMHAADVTQTVHYMLFNLGLMNWLSDLEIFATLIAAIIHDYQHTGTTNNFHVMSGSEIAMMYNDRAVLENFHLSTAFQVMRKEECNITTNLSNEEYKEWRSLIIEMVLATDMNSHFQQIKTIRALLSLPNANLIEEKPKALSLILHCCDISHPSKDWNLHSQWTGLLIEEFFRQGDEERKRGLPYTPLCDRNTTLVPESQIGFIDFIVSPSMDVCGDLLDRIYQSLQSMSCVSSESILDQDETSKSNDRPKSSQTRSKLSIEPTFDQGLSPRPWTSCLEKNKSKWQDKAAEDAKLRAMKKNNGAEKSE